MNAESFSCLLEDHRSDGGRSGEGAAVSLNGSAILLAYACFSGPKDHDPARIVARRSFDGGRTWSEREDFIRAAPGDINVMSVSLLRLADGRIACLYMRKQSPDNCRPWICFSKNDGESWSEPICLAAEPGYYVIDNDRLVQTKAGRLIAPCAFSPDDSSCTDPECVCLFSDDGGESWRRSSSLRLDTAVNLDESYGKLVCQEPGVVEATGRLLMWARTTGSFVARAWSEDEGKTWSRLEPLPGLVAPLSPQSVKKIPGTERLLMLFNDRVGIDRREVAEFNRRTPLSVAVSDDGGETWRKLPELEGIERNYCYASMLFHDDRLLLTYYESALKPEVNGATAHRNLASLKMRSEPIARFLQGF
jgi:Neuraminidase (sialidase)